MSQRAIKAISDNGAGRAARWGTGGNGHFRAGPPPATGPAAGACRRPTRNKSQDTFLYFVSKDENKNFTYLAACFERFLLNF